MLDKNDSNKMIVEELEYFCDTSVKSMINGYVPPKQYFDDEKKLENIKTNDENKISCEIFDPLSDKN